MAEEPSTTASKPAPPHKLRYHGTTAHGVVSRALRGPESGAPHGASVR